MKHTGRCQNGVNVQGAVHHPALWGTQPLGQSAQWRPSQSNGTVLVEVAAAALTEVVAATLQAVTVGVNPIALLVLHTVSPRKVTAVDNYG